MQDNDAVDRARALVGTRFRAQGRDPRYGLDCLGLVIAAFRLGGDVGRRDYRLRGDHRGELAEGLAPWFRRVSRPRRRPGDVLLLRAAPDQIHLGIVTPAGFVHADARLGAVVETPGVGPWPLLAVYRRRVRKARG